MASGMGTPSRYGTANMIQKLMMNPIYQQDIARAQNVGQDKRAVGGIERTLGRAIAGETKKQLANEAIGTELARRKDALEFRRKMAKQQERNFKKTMSYKKGQQGIEFGLGLAATGVNMGTAYRRSKNHKEYMALQRRKLDIIERAGGQMNQNITEDDDFWYGSNWYDVK